MQQEIEENSHREKQSQEMISQLESFVQTKENQMAELKVQYAHLQENNSQMKAAFEQDKLLLEQKSVALVQLKEVRTL